MKNKKELLKLSLVACINDKLALGKNNGLLYHLPSDLKHFKHLTSENVVIMGRATYESLSIKPLPNRVNIVITSDHTLVVPQGHVCSSIQASLDLCRELYKDKKIFVIGGASIYRQFLEKGLIDEMFISHVHDDTEGDVYFPNVFTNGEWEVVDETIPRDTSKDDKNYSVIIYKRKN